MGASRGRAAPTAPPQPQAGVPHQAKLVVCDQSIERTLAWLNRFRRLTVRYERRADIHQAFLTLGCALICWNATLREFC
jgi:transposase